MALLADHFTQLRRYSPTFPDTFDFSAASARQDLMNAIAALRETNRRRIVFESIYSATVAGQMAISKKIQKGPTMGLSDEQWKRIEHLFDAAPYGRRGRPAQDFRRVVDGILWVLLQGERWHHLPSHYPSSQTCYNRWLDWRKSGRWALVVEELGPEVFSFPVSLPQSDQKMKPAAIILK